MILQVALSGPFTRYEAAQHPNDLLRIVTNSKQKSNRDIYRYCVNMVWVDPPEESHPHAASVRVENSSSLTIS